MAESNRKPNTKCNVCGNPVYRRPGELQKKVLGIFCSHHCYGMYQRIEIPCTVCGKMILSGANKKTCSRSCANKNRAGIQYTGRRLKDNVVTIRQLKNRMIEDRGTNCERCDFNICKILQVHHRDRNRSNNNITNLELLCPNCHAIEHYLKK